VRRVALQIHRVTVTNPTGVHRYALSLARALAATAGAGDAVELWAGREDEGEHDVADIEVRAWPVPRRLLHLAWTAMHRPYADRFTGDVSLVHALTAAVPVPTRLPLVVTVHDLLPMQHPEWYDRQSRWAVTRAIRYAAATAACIITPSERVRDDLREHLDVDADRIVVIPEGAGGAFMRAVTAAQLRAFVSPFGVEPGRYFVTVGEIGPRKNLPTLFRALANVREESDVLPLLVIGGDGMDAARTKALVDDLDIGHLVRFTGRVSDDALAALVQGARGLVHPSSYEGFGLTPLEAMAAGTAVISSSAGSLPEVVGEAGLLIDPADVDGWAQAVMTVGRDDDWVAQAVAAGRARAGTFTWEAAARRTWETYERVLAC